MSVEDIYRPGSDLDIPRRPPWSYSMTKEQLDQQEQSAFQDYLSRIHSNHRPQDLSLFEHNLEVRVGLLLSLPSSYLTTQCTRDWF